MKETSITWKTSASYYVYTNDRTKRKSAIIYVAFSIYKHIKDNKSRLFFAHKSCRVFDIISLFMSRNKIRTTEN